MAGTSGACGLVEISTFAVTPEHAGVAGTPEQTAESRVVQPVPNPSDQFPVGAARGRRAVPRGRRATGVVFGDLETTIVQKDRQVAAYEQVGWDFVHEAPYNILGEANWGPFVTALEQDGVEALTFVGEGQNMALLQQAMGGGLPAGGHPAGGEPLRPDVPGSRGLGGRGHVRPDRVQPHLRRRVPGQPGHGQVPRPHGGAGGARSPRSAPRRCPDGCCSSRRLGRATPAR